MSTALPEHFIEWSKKRLKKNSKKFIESLDQSPIRAMLVNPNKNMDADDLENVPWAQYGKYLPSAHPFSQDPLWHAGCYYSMDASCMFLQHAFKEVIDMDQKLRVLDLCAAPGGKTLALSSILKSSQLLVSNDVSSNRAKILKENLIKWGAAHNYLLSQKAIYFQRIPDFYNAIVVDAPCSSEGMFRKRQKTRTEHTTDTVANCATRQKGILKDVLPALRPGGTLFYSTCAFNDQENIEIAEWLCKEHGFEALKISLEKEWNIEELKKGDAVGYQFWPHRTRGEGFFLSVLRKKAPEDYEYYEEKLRRRIKPLSKRIHLKIKRFFHLPNNFKLHENARKAIYAYHEDLEDDFLRLNGLYNPIYYGVELGMLAKELFMPLHSLAMNGVVKPRIKFIELPYDQALRYLKREQIDVKAEIIGWVIATFQDIPLGWIKLGKKSVKNNYPINWRLKK